MNINNRGLQVIGSSFFLRNTHLHVSSGLCIILESFVHSSDLKENLGVHSSTSLSPTASERASYASIIIAVSQQSSLQRLNSFQVTSHLLEARSNCHPHLAIPRS